MNQQLLDQLATSTQLQLSTTNLIDKLSFTIEKLHSALENQPKFDVHHQQQLINTPLPAPPLLQNNFESQLCITRSRLRQSQSQSSIPVTITGSSVVIDLEPGKLSAGDKQFDIKIHTKPGATIKQLINLVNNNRIGQHFNNSSRAIISICSIDMKQTDSKAAIDGINQLVLAIRRKHQHIKPAFVTIPLQFEPQLKPSLQQQLNHDIEDFNR
ncbi:unnamed protein product [Didymodactylos carnosus]|uniref:Uncharacterized protein n=1 Tax=Didymodactylos carnosus TaxID=1234261 RepID=A0A815KG69_9BILA|nr:unnamed protein product [Didymodactylos carnosus]CAF1435170.1 unnamed protein product [Didymodactylos carnosus]CAF4232566.1 unnamed protein product [Didymodactylos carnosus]CAF4286921.1 unnamed protein product [Didymodactylos carnosus]